MSRAVPQRHLLAAGAHHMGAPAQHKLHMDLHCLPAMGAAPARTLHESSSAMTPPAGSWSPSYGGSSTTRASYGLVLLASDGCCTCQDTAQVEQCHDATCWQLEPIIWGLQHNMSFIWTRVARQRSVRQPHRLWLQRSLMGHVGDGRNVVVVVEECAWHGQHEHMVT